MERDGINRRRFVRRKFPFTVHISYADAEPISTYTQDISIGGIKVSINRELTVSSLLSIEIFTEKKTIKCTGRVAWIGYRQSRILEGKRYCDTGIEFEDIASENRSIIETQSANIDQP